ncbi:tetraacyldisaccharide 4'-kinase [Actinobacillus equuli]|nr:tetraacyldisaccharide 4'-kinase [Actinobacillus equuli]
MLENLGIKLLKTQGFADHQAFEPTQLKALASEQIPLLMTEKDAVKCRTLPSQIGGIYLFLQNFRRNRPLVYLNRF